MVEAVRCTPIELGRSTHGNCQARNMRPERSDLADAPRHDPASLAIITSQPNRLRHIRGRVLCVSDVRKWEANYQFRFVDFLSAAPLVDTEVSLGERR